MSRSYTYLSLGACVVVAGQLYVTWTEWVGSDSFWLPCLIIGSELLTRQNLVIFFQNLQSDSKIVRQNRPLPFSLIQHSTAWEVLAIQLIKKFRVIYGTRGFVTVFTKPATGSCPDPVVCSPHSNPWFSKTYFNIIVPCTPLSPKCSLQVFRQKFLCSPQLLISCVLRVLSISVPCISLPIQFSQSPYYICEFLMYFVCCYSSY
jgi:hypothetical protein